MSRRSFKLNPIYIHIFTINKIKKFFINNIFNKSIIYKTYYFFSINQWKNSQTYLRLSVFEKYVKKFLLLKKLHINTIFLLIGRKNTNIHINNIGFFSAHKADYNYPKIILDLNKRVYLKEFAKIFATYIELNNTNRLNFLFHSTYVFKKLLIKKVKYIFRKNIHERYFLSSLQIVYFTFIGFTNSKVLSFLIYTHIAKNPRRIRFLAFLKRLFDWYFLTIKNSKSKISGVRIEIKGRFNAKSRTKKQILTVGRIRKKEATSPVDFRKTVAITKFGSLGIKVWICPKNNII
jgi:hypothetical protein